MQLSLRVAAMFVLLSTAARADDSVDSTLSWFDERRPNSRSVSVIHPQLDAAVDFSSWMNFSAGYEADIVSGATPGVYAVPKPGTGETIDAITNATQFKDFRQNGHGALTFSGSRSSLTVGYGYGTERDYRSNTINTAASVDLPGKNTTFAVSYSRNIDRVCDFANGDATPLERRPLTGSVPCFQNDPSAVTHDLDIDTAQASITQNLSPTAVAQAGIYGEIARGFQSNPYRRVRVFDVEAQENDPEIRDRGAVFLRLNVAFPTLHAAANVFTRAYSDNWGVTSGTVELLYDQYVGRHILMRLRGRFYQQTGAIFFRDAVDYQNVGPVGAYFTGDRELAPLRDYLGGFKLAYLAQAEEGRRVWGLFDDVDFHLTADCMWVTSLTANLPGGVPSGPLPESIVAQIGLLMRY